MPELVLRKALWRSGIRYRLRNTLPGRPDLVFLGAKVAVFVDGCFWHRCPIHSVAPRTNQEFWEAKLSGNVARDRKNDGLLASQGWRVLRFWEHEVQGGVAEVVEMIGTVLEGA